MEQDEQHWEQKAPQVPQRVAPRRVFLSTQSHDSKVGKFAKKLNIASRLTVLVEFP